MYARDYLTQCYIYIQVNTISSHVKVTLHEDATYSLRFHTVKTTMKEIRMSLKAL